MNQISFFLQPWEQYAASSTSVLVEEIEPASEVYPSVTICKDFKSSTSPMLDLLKAELDRGRTHIDVKGYTELIGKFAAYILPPYFRDFCVLFLGLQVSTYSQN